MIDLFECALAKFAKPLSFCFSQLNMLNVIFDKLGSLIERYVPWLLKILLVIMAVISTLLTKYQDRVSDSCLSMARNLRTNAMNRIIQVLKFAVCEM